VRMTPLDIQSHRFRRSFSGLDSAEVESFLRMVSEDYEALLRESESRRDENRRLETRLEELVANESLLKETLLSAHAICDDMRRTAVKESEVLLSEAEVRAEKILDASHRRSAQLAQDIREMRTLRTRLAAALRNDIQTHLGLIESLERDPEEVEAVTLLEPTILSSEADLSAAPNPVIQPTAPQESGDAPDPTLRAVPPAG
jgi:cell division initiation protein